MEKEENVSLEDLSKMGITEEDCKPFIAESEKAEPTTEEKADEPVEEKKEPEKVEENASDTLEDDLPTAADGVKSVPEDHSDNLKIALSKERALRKAERAEKLALETELAKYRQQSSQPMQPVSSDIQTKIRNDAREKAIKDLNIDDPANLMFVDPEKYENFIAAKTRNEIEMSRSYEQKQKTYNDNLSFSRELSAIPEIGKVIEYGSFDLTQYKDVEEMKKKTAITKAYYNVDHGVGSQSDIEMLRSYLKECQTAINAKAPVVTPNTTKETNNVSDKLSIADTLPKATQLNGSGVKASMSWEEVANLASQQKWEQIPPGMLKILEENKII